MARKHKINKSVSDTTDLDLSFLDNNTDLSFIDDNLDFSFIDNMDLNFNDIDFNLDDININIDDMQDDLEITIKKFKKV